MKSIKFIFLILTLNIFGQNSNYCHPTTIIELSEKIINKLPQKEIDRVLLLDNYGKYFSFDSFYLFNYKDYKLVLNYTNLNGVREIPEYKIERIISRYIFHKLKGNHVCISEIAQPYIDKLKKRQEYVDLQKEKDIIDDIYIPLNINDAINQLDTILSSKKKRGIKKLPLNNFIGESHFGLGRRIRNGWGLYGNSSRLSSYFERFGITFSESMSSIILKCYHRHLNSEPINFDEEIKLQLRFKRPKKKNYPKLVKNVKWFQTIFITDDDENSVYSLLFFRNLNRDVRWVYHYDFGWKKINLIDYNNLIEICENYDEYLEVNNWLMDFYNKE